MSPNEKLLEHLGSSGPKVLVEVISTKGSAPRENDAFMLVSDTDVSGTIGGGQLEFMSIDHALQMLAGTPVSPMLSIPLGPEIGQCCGGRVEIGFRMVDDSVSKELHNRLFRRKSLAETDLCLWCGPCRKGTGAGLKPPALRP